ncbi:transcription termination factor NusA [Chlamydiota bacterium]
MNGELLSVLDYIEREKGIDRGKLIEAIELSLVSASKKTLAGIHDPSFKIDPETGKISVYQTMQIVKTVSDSETEISLKEARKIDPQAKNGEEIKIEITPKDFGRIAAQTAKQVIVQKIREAEKEIVYAEFKDRIGDIIMGTVLRHEHDTVIVDIGRSEALLPYREQCPGERYPIRSRIRAYILEVKSHGKALDIILSRVNPNLVKILFELEVPEIIDGIVEIKAIAREAGSRTKIAVFSQSEKVDCVGACVGMRGDRVKNIVRELNGERIDIVPWDEDVGSFVRHSLSPAKLKSVKVKEDERTVEVIVTGDQLSLAIGKKGQNARLSSRLTGWKIDINKDMSDIEAEKTKALDKDVPVHDISIDEVAGIGKKTRDTVKKAGFKTTKDIIEKGKDSLKTIPGISDKMAERIINAVYETSSKLDDKKDDQGEDSSE